MISSIISFPLSSSKNLGHHYSVIEVCFVGKTLGHDKFWLNNHNKLIITCTPEAAALKLAIVLSERKRKFSINTSACGYLLKDMYSTQTIYICTLSSISFNKYEFWQSVRKLYIKEIKQLPKSRQ